MKELQTARVVIIDDDHEEGEGLRRALAKDGIPSLVFASEEDLPSDPLTGVRLAALDADLAGLYGTGPSDDAITDPTARMVAELLSDGNGPYYALIWTKHADLAASLEGRLKARGVPATACTTLAKGRVRSDGKWNIPKILREIQKSQRDLPGLRFLSEWERAVFDAGVTTVSTLLRGETDTEVLGALSYVERRTASGSEKLRAIAQSLSRLHADALDRRRGQYGAEALRPLLSGDIPKPSEKRRAQLHSRLLLGTAEPGASPGSIYVLDSIASRLGRPKWFPGMEAITQDFGGDADRIAGVDATPIAVEVTPLCDEHRGGRITRFLVGAAFETPELSNKRRKDLRKLESEALRNFGPLIVPGLGHVDIVWCSRLAFTAPIEKVKTLKPVGRLRYDVLVDLQSWISAQASRPGYLSLST